MTLSHGPTLAKAKIWCSESISPCNLLKMTFTLICAHQNKKHSDLALLNLNSRHSSFLASFKSSPHSALSFSNSISFHSEVQFLPKPW